MARLLPFVFCRYQLHIDGEALDSMGQQQFLVENQGHEIPYGRGHHDRIQATALIMSPVTHDNGVHLSWLVGIRSGFRPQHDYDRSSMEVSYDQIADKHIKHARVLAMPELGAMAIEDRSNDANISARQTIAAFRTIVYEMTSLQGSFSVKHGNPEDVKRWLKDWDLIEYSYTIGPLNPISASDLAEKRSTAMKQEKIKRETGKVQPETGGVLKMNDGVIAEADALSDVGYGQRGFRGKTSDGHIAHVPKPPYHPERAKNKAEQQKQQFVRILIDPEENESIEEVIFNALGKFYSR